MNFESGSLDEAFAALCALEWPASDDNQAASVSRGCKIVDNYVSCHAILRDKRRRWLARTRRLRELEVEVSEQVCD